LRAEIAFLAEWYLNRFFPKSLTLSSRHTP
jgi:hypothetical protein